MVTSELCQIFGGSPKQREPSTDVTLRA